MPGAIAAYDDTDLDLAPEPPEFEPFALAELAEVETEEGEFDLDLAAISAEVATGAGEAAIVAAELDELLLTADPGTADALEALLVEVQGGVAEGDAALADFDADAQGDTGTPTGSTGGGTGGTGGGGGLGGGGGCAATCCDRNSPDWPCTI